MSAREARRRLQLVLRANAATSTLCGLAGLLGAGFFSDRLGVDHVALTAVVSAGLVVFGLDVAWTSLDEERAVRFGPLVTAADAAWVAATVVVLAIGALSTAGTVVAIVVGIGVADFAMLQAWLRTRAVARQERLETLAAA